MDRTYPLQNLIHYLISLTLCILMFGDMPTASPSSHLCCLFYDYILMLVDYNSSSMFSFDNLTKKIISQQFVPPKFSPGAMPFNVS